MILLIDDDKDLLRLEEKTLLDEGYIVKTSNTGNSGLDAILENLSLLSVIILNWTLPDYSGLELLRIIRQNEKLRYIPIVMQTVTREDSEIRQAIEAGAYYCIVKPVDLNMLKSITRAAKEHSDHFKVVQLQFDDSVVNYRLMQKATYRFQTLEECDKLSRSLAHATREAYRVQFGLNELLTNAVEHGNLQIDYDTKTEMWNQGDYYNNVNLLAKKKQFNSLFFRKGIQQSWPGYSAG